MGAFLDMPAFLCPSSGKYKCKDTVENLCHILVLTNCSSRDSTNSLPPYYTWYPQVVCIVCIPWAIFLLGIPFIFINYYLQSHQLEFLLFSDHLFRIFFFFKTPFKFKQFWHSAIHFLFFAAHFSCGHFQTCFNFLCSVFA